ncbi:hypothetical protein NC652_013481 [Populus alba x Populus x berolinensis]|uniref:Uncharacterized protein n=1 Tax=Populus alba x Populus x berolinensis TaxID=444605 RepID=A0AAD6QUJ8_9ROSI|nr:hypothetical protein NC652_013481 [Populus alba x Populus x berolinensis]KAJ6996834.1 hypothetical protein NC653_013430 [Populus alba x Populus x berolinensis]
MSCERKVGYLHEKVQLPVIHRERSDQAMCSYLKTSKPRSQILTFRIMFMVWLLTFIQLEF